MGKATNIRLKVLKATSARRHHYRVIRFFTQTLSLAILVGVPLTGLARVDFYTGHHHLLFQPAPFKHALGGVILAIAAMYVVTFLSNVIAGRLFCGWGCPVGQVSRLGERVDTPGLKPLAKLKARILGGAYSILFVVSVFTWWLDPRILIADNPNALAIGWGLIFVGTLGAYLHGRYWRWSFCKNVCPIGWYYSFVSPARYFGIHFRNQQSTCIECDACDNICPVDLAPRDLASAVTDRRGISISDAPGFNHCLACGDCVDACDRMIQLRNPKGYPEAVPLHMGYFRGPQRLDANDT